MLAVSVGASTHPTFTFLRFTPELFQPLVLRNVPLRLHDYPTTACGSHDKGPERRHVRQNAHLVKIILQNPTGGVTWKLSIGPAKQPVFLWCWEQGFCFVLFPP